MALNDDEHAGAIQAKSLQEFDKNEKTIEVDLRHESQLSDDKCRECFDDFSSTPLVVYLKDVNYCYDKKTKLLNGLNLNIAAGQIYSLLGPSGCGKSTTLKLILGLLKPHSGQIKVFGKTPATAKCPVPGRGCGYMPQDLSMMPTMSIENHFLYYGRLNGMSIKEILTQSRILCDLLQIPPMNRAINKLSGGQQRRTSLALALLHQPPLLILDEPTVGIDPILRNKVWNYLLELCQVQHKTIIITTHYIEEARQANTISLMRSGRLLAEANPTRLLETFQMNTIEEVFLELCENDDNNKNSETEESADNLVLEEMKIVTNREPTFMPYKPEPGKRKQRFRFDCLRVHAMMIDVLTYAKFCIITVFGASLLPMMQVFLFHSSVGKPILDLSVAVSANQTPNSFEHIFLENLKSRNVHFQYFQTENEAFNAAKDGFAFAAFNFPSNFSKCLINRARRGVNVKPWNINCSTMRFAPDNTFQFVIFQLGLMMRDAFFYSIEHFYPQHNYHPQAINVPFKTEELVYGTDQFDYQTFMTPGMYMALIYLAPMVVSVFMLLEHKAQGHFERSQANGVKSLEVIVAHYGVEFMILLVQNGLMLFTSLTYFNAQNHGSYLLLFFITLCVGMAGISTALSSAVILRTKIAGLIMLYAFTISLWMICGIFWPTENIEFAFFRWLVPFLPLTLPTETARNIMNRGWGIDHYKVWIGFVVAFVYILLPVCIAIRRLK